MRGIGAPETLRRSLVSHTDGSKSGNVWKARVQKHLSSERTRKAYSAERPRRDATSPNGLFPNGPFLKVPARLLCELSLTPGGGEIVCAPVIETGPRWPSLESFAPSFESDRWDRKRPRRATRVWEPSSKKFRWTRRRRGGAVEVEEIPVHFRKCFIHFFHGFTFFQDTIFQLDRTNLLFARKVASSTPSLETRRLQSERRLTDVSKVPSLSLSLSLSRPHRCEISYRRASRVRIAEKRISEPQRLSFLLSNSALSLSRERHEPSHLYSEKVYPESPIFFRKRERLRRRR